MANWTVLSDAIRQVIYSNGTRDITGQILQTALLNIINNVGYYAGFGGYATPSTNPGIPDGPVFYIANTVGTYVNFGNLSITSTDGWIAFVYSNGSWSKVDFGGVSQGSFNALAEQFEEEFDTNEAARDALVEAKVGAVTELQNIVEGEEIEVFVDYTDAIVDDYAKKLEADGSIAVDSTQARTVNVYALNNASKCKIVGTTYSSGTSLAAFYNSETVFDSTTFISLVPYSPTGNPTTLNMEVTVPSGAKAIAICRYNVTSTIPKVEQLKFYKFIRNNNLKEKVDALEEKTDEIDDLKQIVDGDTIDVYIPYANSIQSLYAKKLEADGSIAVDSTQARTVNVYALNNASKCKIVGTTYSSGTSLAAFYNSETVFDSTTFISLVPYSPTGNPTTLNMEVTVPSGAKAIAICRYSNTSTLPLTEQIVFYLTEKSGNVKERLDEIEIPNLSYRINGDRIEIVSKFGNGKDRMVTLSKTGINGLFDFVSFKDSLNSRKAPSQDFDSFVGVGDFGTDLHSPFQIEALNNADGDNKSGGDFRLYFTGGQHGYNNTGNNTTATARTVSLKFFINDREETEGYGYANKITIEWVNYVQGFNTTKSDGSGREILSEKHTLKFDGDVWNELIDLVPLEDLDFITYYSFQFKWAPTYNSIKYIGASNRAESNPAISETNSGSKHCSAIVCTGQNEYAKIFIDENLDLGKRDLSLQYGAISNDANNPKCYTVIAKVGFEKIRMQKDCHYYVRGGYEFKPL